MLYINICMLNNNLQTISYLLAQHYGYNSYNHINGTIYVPSKYAKKAIKMLARNGFNSPVLKLGNQLYLDAY